MLLIVLNCKTRERYENKQKAGIPLPEHMKHKSFSLQVVSKKNCFFHGFIDAGVNIEMLIAAGEPKYNI